MVLIIFLVAIFSFVLAFLLPNLRKNETFHPPPGPKRLPFIGNLHQIDPLQPHVYFAKLAKTNGPIVSLQLGRVPVVVVQSAKLAKEVLKTQDANFCSRPSLAGIKKLNYNGFDIAFCPYNDYFREIKKISVVHLLSSKRVESFAPIRLEEVSKMIEQISNLSSASQVVNLSELLILYGCSNICRVAFGKRYDDDGGSKSKFHKMLNDAQAMLAAAFFIDYLPFFGWLDYLTGKFATLKKIFKDLDHFYEQIINDHLEPQNKPQRSDSREHILDVLLNLNSKNSFRLTLDQIKAVLMNIFLAGSDTSASTVVWAMTELVRNPNVMKKVQEELRNALQHKGCIENDDLEGLEYFKAVVKETFRLHPPVPLLVVRETILKTTIEGYDILPKTLLYVNAWAIGRDPNSWNDAEEFKPERFLESSINYRGNDFELLPFGAGRRICPGINLAIATVELALANLLYAFDWELPEGSKDEVFDNDTLPGIATHKKIPLRLIARPKYL